MSLPRRALCWATCALVYAYLVQVCTDNHQLFTHKQVASRSLSDAQLLLHEASFELRPLLARHLQGWWDSPLSL